MNEMDVIIPENFAVDEASELRESFYGWIEKDEKCFKLDFSKCTFIDSTGLGVLVSVYKRCMEKNGSFRLYSVNPQVMRIFKLTRLDRVFQID